MDNTIFEILHEIKQAQSIRVNLEHRILAAMAEIRRAEELEKIYAVKIDGIMDKLIQERIKQEE